MKPALRPSRIGAAASRGVTMIELLVAITISLLITLVIAQLFLGSRQTFATTDDVSRMQENTRFAQQLLIRLVHLAGYKSQPNSITLTVFDPATNPAIAATNGAGTASDTLTIRYQGSGDGLGAPDGTVVDCLGAAVDSGVFAVNTFSIAQNPTTLRNGLFCSNQPAGANPQELVPDVANMQILFGEDTNADLTADHYVALPGIANPSNIVSVRIALLFQTPTVVSKALADATTYTLDPVSLPQVVLGPFNDRQIRRMVTTTINLRNRTP